MFYGKAIEAASESGKVLLPEIGVKPSLSPPGSRQSAYCVSLLVAIWLLCTTTAAAEGIPAPTSATSTNNPSVPGPVQSILQERHQEYLDALIQRNTTLSSSSASRLSQQAMPALPESFVKNHETRLQAISTRVRHDSPELIKPLISLGTAYAHDQSYQEAIDSLLRATHIIRMNFGLYSLKQIPVLDHLISYQLALDQVPEAEKHQRHAYFLLRRHYHDNLLETLATEYRMADWYMQLKSPAVARVFHYRAIKRLENEHGPDYPGLILPLKKLANAYKKELNPLLSSLRPNFSKPTQQAYITGSKTTVSSPGNVQPPRWNQVTRIMKRIIDIQSGDPMTTPRELANSYLDLADWYMLTGKNSRSIQYYRKAMALFNTARKDGHEKTAWPVFSIPYPLYVPMVRPLKQLDIQKATYKRQEGIVEFKYTVDRRGLVRNLKVVKSSPPGLREQTIKKTLTSARYRPRFDGDTPVETSGLHYRHRYFYWKESVSDT